MSTSTSPPMPTPPSTTTSTSRSASASASVASAIGSGSETTRVGSQTHSLLQSSSPPSRSGGGPRSETTTASSTLFSFPDPGSISLASPSATRSLADHGLGSPVLMSPHAGQYTHLPPPPAAAGAGREYGSGVAGPSGSNSYGVDTCPSGSGSGGPGQGPGGMAMAMGTATVAGPSHSPGLGQQQHAHSRGGSIISLQSSLPSPTTQQAVNDARAALVASMGNLLDNELQTRAQSLHAGQKSIEKQERDVQKGIEGLRKENDKLMKLVKEAGNGVKMTGNVQHFAETLEREFLILEETVKLANEGWSSEDEEGSWTGSETESDGDGMDGAERGSVKGLAGRRGHGDMEGVVEMGGDAKHKDKDKGKDVAREERRRVRREEERREFEREEEERQRRENQGTFEERMRAMELDQIPKDKRILVKLEEGGRSTAVETPTEEQMMGMMGMMEEMVKEELDRANIPEEVIAKAEPKTEAKTETGTEQHPETKLKEEEEVAARISQAQTQPPSQPAAAAASECMDIIDIPASVPHLAVQQTAATTQLLTDVEMQDAHRKSTEYSTSGKPHEEDSSAVDTLVDVGVQSPHAQTPSSAATPMEQQRNQRPPPESVPLPPPTNDETYYSNNGCGGEEDTNFITAAMDLDDNDDDVPPRTEGTFSPATPQEEAPRAPPPTRETSTLGTESSGGGGENTPASVASGSGGKDALLQSLLLSSTPGLMSATGGGMDLDTNENADQDQDETVDVDIEMCPTPTPTPAPGLSTASPTSEIEAALMEAMVSPIHERFEGGEGFSAAAGSR